VFVFVRVCVCVRVCVSVCEQVYSSMNSCRSEYQSVRACAVCLQESVRVCEIGSEGGREIDTRKSLNDRLLRKKMRDSPDKD